MPTAQSEHVLYTDVAAHTPSRPQRVRVRDLENMRYAKAWDYQEQLLADSKQRKRGNRGLSPTDTDYEQPEHHLLWCHHPPVYTLGKSGSKDHVLLSDEQLREADIDFFKINRGGDITYHGPGQIVGYPILDLDELFTDIHRYVRYLEEAVIRTCAEYGVVGGRIPGLSGVWLEKTDTLPQRKICAVGVHLSRWVTMHGFAFNVNTDLRYFDHIVPCGIDDKDKGVTSLARELGKGCDYYAVRDRVEYHLSQLFGLEVVR